MNFVVTSLLVYTPGCEIIGTRKGLVTVYPKKDDEKEDEKKLQERLQHTGRVDEL